jgi:glycosyltransferase involved in cell wall biosynthesis
MGQPTVSVIIPAYNCGDLIAEAVESVRRQTYQDLECIVVDDGSTDDTWQVLEALASRWERLRTFRIAHAGLAAARNRGIAEMRGQWLALLDADDLWLPRKLQRCMDYLRAHPDLSIVYTPMTPIRRDGTPMTGHSKPCHAGWLTQKLFLSIFIHDPAVVMHKRVVDTCGGFDETLPVGVGHEFWLRVSTRFEFGLIEEPLALRRWSEETLTRSNRSRARCTKAAMLERFYWQRGGRDAIPRPAAMRRLARVHYAAGKILIVEGRPRAAAGHLAKALRFRPAFLKAYPFYAAAKLLALLRPDSPEPA